MKTSGKNLKRLHPASGISKVRRMLPLAVILLMVATSCRFAKDLTYFSDIEKGQSLFGFPKEATEYRIRPLDNLYVSIQTNNPEVNQQFTLSGNNNGFISTQQQTFAGLPDQSINGYLVDANGIISFPTIGNISVVGLTLLEAQNRIRDLSLQYLKVEPIVKVRILSFKVNVTGEVRNPGLYYNYLGKLNVLDAISMANGITDYAKIKNIIVIRQNKFNTKTFALDLTSKKLFESEAFYLQPDDLIYIPPGKFKNTGLNTPTYSLVFSALSSMLISASFILNLVK
jgi:polysaccharide biosynthesis/export protein